MEVSVSDDRGAQQPRVLTRAWAETSETLPSLAADADLILTGTTCQEVAANVAEARHVPLAALHAAWSLVEWVAWPVMRLVEDSQRRALRLPPIRVPASQTNRLKVVVAQLFSRTPKR